MGFQDLNNLDRDPDMAKAIGNMIVAWSHAETALVNVLAAITAIHFNMANVAYYRIPTFEARVKVIQAALTQWRIREEKRNKVSTAVAKLGKLAGTRNHWIHGVWSVAEDTGKLVIFDFRAPDGPRRRTPAKTHDVLHHTATVKKRTKDITDLVPLKVVLAP